MRIDLQLFFLYNISKIKILKGEAFFFQSKVTKITTLEKTSLWLSYCFIRG